jgi:hypothetical protein
VERATITLRSKSDDDGNSIRKKRKEVKLKRIVASEQNYIALRRLGHAGDSFNDVVTKLLQIQK